MCTSEQHKHPCQHTTVLWNYCRDSFFLLGRLAPCQAYTTAATGQDMITNVSAPCGRSDCYFYSMPFGRWRCCQCGCENTRVYACDGQGLVSKFNEKGEVVDRYSVYCCHNPRSTSGSNGEFAPGVNEVEVMGGA
ncbi:hypothetical protein B0T22DRAFT_479959 [Podospora appendiculata]|uniref:Uncharacterized protein n=1 Tax=Podospora appendiculata TaxID=314037 RepID=A0AAE1CCK6_9PEZI|nr:hypothetical protein B0T22DRAFT_479959 [Podospora appendiculata]